MSKNNFHEIVTIFKTQIGPKIENDQNLLRFGTFNIF